MNNVGGETKEPHSEKRGLVDAGQQQRKQSRVTAAGPEQPEHAWMSNFAVPAPLPEFQWKPPPSGLSPATRSKTAAALLVHDTFIDKSAALFQLLSDVYDNKTSEFDSTPLQLVFPRRFAKTTLLRFIKAVYSPLPRLEGFASKDVKTKIAALEKGPALLAFGLRPVIYLDMQSLDTVTGLMDLIDRSLEQAGLKDASSFCNGRSPAEYLLAGVSLLNKKFKNDTGKDTLTMLLVDEYDKPFRNKNADTGLIAALTKLYGISKNEESGTSIVVLCGLTRMVGTGLSSLNNLIDISRTSKYHGICGISAAELVHCAKDTLDGLTKKKYNGQTFKDILEGEFRLRWNGFRFGVDQGKGILDPSEPEGALFSPLDAWELIESLRDTSSSTAPSSQWMATMQSEFEFSSFAEKYLASEDVKFQLMDALRGGWMERDRLKTKMSREQYMVLESDLDVQKVLFELGLLTVTGMDDKWVRLGSPNWTVTENAMMMLVKKIRRVETTEEEAKHYVSEEGLKELIAMGAKKVSNLYGKSGRAVMREYPFQDFTYFELLRRFPLRESEQYELFKEVFSHWTKGSGQKHGWNDIAVELRYGTQKKVFIIELKIEKKDSNAAATVENAHEKNLQEAITQVKTYVWKKTDCKNVQKIALSGVWCPEDGTKNYCLHTRLAFVD